MSLASERLGLAERSIVAALRLIPPGTRGKLRLARRLLLPLLSQRDAVIVTLPGGQRLAMPSALEPVAFHCLIDGTYEPELMGLLRLYLPAGGTFLDVGANVGVFTLAAARSAGRVVAIEASPEIGTFLSRNVGANGCRNVTVVAKAVAESGPQRLAFWPAPREKFGMGALAPQFDGPAIAVDADTIDNILTALDIDRVDVVKMDIEGFEAGAFRGARRLLSSGRPPVVIFEFADWAESRAGAQCGDAQRVLRGLGYSLKLIGRGGRLREARGATHVRKRQHPGVAIRSPYMTRLAIFTTHPIQYQAPWFRALAAVDGLDLHVVFSHVPDAARQGEGFGIAFQWDIPLLAGYRHRRLATTELPRPAPGFAQRWANGLGPALDQIRPDAAMVLGWQEISLVQALLACRRRGIPVILRGRIERPAAATAARVAAASPLFRPVRCLPGHRPRQCRPLPCRRRAGEPDPHRRLLRGQ